MISNSHLCVKTIFVLVIARTETKLSTSDQPCEKDPEYDYYKCIESHFYTQRGCQYPWNSYQELNLPICKSYTSIKDMIQSMDPSMGFEREKITNSERLSRTKDICPPPCSSTKYDIKFDWWTMHGSGVSLQIAFSDFIIVHTEEYLACDVTCIFGQLGGNLGLFLGGSILLGLDIIMGLIVRFSSSVYSKLIRI